MRRRAVLSMLALPAAAWPQDSAPAPPAEVRAELPGARLQGGGRYRYFGFRVYDIHLWTGEARAGDDWAGVPLALVIDYARSFSAAAIAERSLSEMRRQAEIAPAQADRWLAAMKGAFRDVNEGDRLSGVQRPGEGARFFFNGQPSGEVNDPEFTRLFFGIWLSVRTSEPALRAALLGTPP